DLVVRHAREQLAAQAPVDEPLGERSQRLALSSRKAARTQHPWIGREQFGWRGHVPSEVLLEVRDYRPGRADRELLPRDLEHERPEGIERGELVHPRPWAEIRSSGDQPSKDGVGLPKSGAGMRIGECSSRAASNANGPP